MKIFLTLFVLVFSISFFGCSSIEDSSPVAPEMQKQVLGLNDATGAYEYLQCFTGIPVEYFGESSNLEGVLEVEVSKNNWFATMHHLYVVLEYGDDISENQLLFINKPASNNFTIAAVDCENLVDVRLFAFCTSRDKYVTPPYGYKTCFEEQVVDSWKTTSGEIEIEIGDFKANTGDTFVELEIKSDSFLTYIMQPDGPTILIPKFGDQDITGVKVYSILN